MFLLEEENKPDVGGESVVIERMVEDYVVLNSSDVCVDESAPLQYVSVIYIGVYIVALGLVRILSKIVITSYSISPFEILATQGSISLLFHLAYLWYYNIALFDVESSRARTVLLAALIGFLAMLSHYYAVQNLPLGTALALEYVSYQFASFFDSIFFFLMIRSSQIAGYATAFLGIVALIFEKHESSQALPSGVLIGLLGSLLSGIYSVLSRLTIAKVNPVLCIIYMNFLAASFSTAFISIGNTEQSLPQHTAVVTIILGLIGVFGWITDLALSKAIQEEKILARPYLFRYILVGAGFIVDIFSGQISFLELLGLALIGVQFLLIMLQK